MIGGRLRFQLIFIYLDWGLHNRADRKEKIMFGLNCANSKNS